jgi:hypothetical protein
MSRALLFSVLAFLSLGGLAQESGQGTQPTPQTEQMQQMQTRMQAMREQMARIHATEDPEERQRLMQEHMRSMHEGMMMMGRMMGGPGAQEPMRQCQEGDTECRMSQMQMQQQMMGQRMGMMQQMMEQMMEQMMQGRALETPEAAEAPDAAAEGESHEEHH